MKNKKYPARKLKWKDIQITRVKLNPEQAVLACCDPASKAFKFNGSQCVTQGTCGVNTIAASSSS